MTDDRGSLQEQIDHLEAQLTFLKEKQAFYSRGSERWRLKRDGLNQKCKETGEEITHFKSNRDRLNQQVKELKTKKEQLIADLEKRRREHALLQVKYTRLINKSSQSQTEVTRQIESLDWQIQTSPLPPEKEAQMIHQIRILEQERLIHREATKLKKKMEERHLIINTLKSTIKEVRQQIVCSAGQSQENHTAMLNKIEEIKATKAEADKAHQNFLKYAKKKQEIHSKHTAYFMQINDLIFQLKQLEKKRTQLSNQELAVQRKRATKKLKEQKKMSLEEFKALMKKGLV